MSCAALILAFDGTTVGVAVATGTTAVVVGLIGYFSSRLSANVARRQSDNETNRFREQHREDHFRHRQGVYHEALNAERQLLDVLNRHDFTRAQAIEAYRVVSEAINGVVLFGTAEIAARADDLHEIIGGTYVAADDWSDQTVRWEDAVVAAMLERGRDWVDARTALTNEMRSDVAVDRLPARPSKRD